MENFKNFDQNSDGEHDYGILQELNFDQLDTVFRACN